MDADGGNIKQLTGDYINSVFCSFSPDGNNILYSVKPNTGTSQLYTMGVDGRGKVNISGGVQSYSDYQADWYQPVS
jgi:Tol biopolymer transport system component